MKSPYSIQLIRATIEPFHSPKGTEKLTVYWQEIFVTGKEYIINDIYEEILDDSEIETYLLFLEHYLSDN